MKALLERLASQAENIAEERRRKVGAAWASVPGATTSREGDRVAISGRGLKRRWLDDARLRFARWSDR